MTETVIHSLVNMSFDSIASKISPVSNICAARILVENMLNTAVDGYPPPPSYVDVLRSITHLLRGAEQSSSLLLPQVDFDRKSVE